MTAETSSIILKKGGLTYQKWLKSAFILLSNYLYSVTVRCACRSVNAHPEKSKVTRISTYLLLVHLYVSPCMVTIMRKFSVPNAQQENSADNYKEKTLTPSSIKHKKGAKM